MKYLKILMKNSPKKFFIYIHFLSFLYLTKDPIVQLLFYYICNTFISEMVQKNTEKIFL
jgi:hypothetical protein